MTSNFISPIKRVRNHRWWRKPITLTTFLARFITRSLSRQQLIRVHKFCPNIANHFSTSTLIKTYVGQLFVLHTFCSPLLFHFLTLTRMFRRTKQTKLQNRQFSTGYFYVNYKSAKKKGGFKVGYTLHLFLIISPEINRDINSMINISLRCFVVR